jgi:hypothetical protein
MAIELLAHRGLWRDPAEQNTLRALERALRAGWGLETDIRDRDLMPVIAHDPATDRAPALGELFDLYATLQVEATLALNIKATGLADTVRQLVRSHGIENYFVFDMSVPDTLTYAAAGVPFYSRQSDLEPAPALYEACAGIWLDALHAHWYDRRVIDGHLANGKSVCIVSPELHGRRHEDVWRMVESFPDRAGSLLVCTDFPHLFPNNRNVTNQSDHIRHGRRPHRCQGMAL